MRSNRSGWSRWAADLGSAGGIAAVGFLDYLTGPDLGFFLFYLLPILLGTWFGHRGIGFSAAVLSAVVWWHVDRVGGRTYDVQLVQQWNALIRLGAFVIMAVLLGALRRLNNTLELRIEEKTEHVRRLASEVASAEARERERVARLLHDDLQQQLHAMQFQLVDIRDRTREAGLQAIQESVEESLGALQEASRTTRTLATELSPPALRNDDFSAAIRWLAEHFRARHGLTVRVDASAGLAFPPGGGRDLLFSLVRECLFNVVKHAGVHEARVTIRQIGAHAEVAVEDAGKGMEHSSLPSSADSGTGFGLRSAAQRLELYGGTIRIESGSERRGTRIVITLPTLQRSGAPPDRLPSGLLTIASET